MKIFELFKDNFLHVNILKTIYFNFRALPFRQAIKFPVFVGYNVKLRNIGNIQIEGDIKPAKVSLGVIRNPWEVCDTKLLFNNRGTIVFNGKIKIHPGVKLYVKSGALLKFGTGGTIGARTLLVCHKQITLGDDAGCSWDCQIIDTDFHFVIDLIANEPLRRTQKITICNHVFIGNHCNIRKGTYIPDNTIVSSHSDVSGSFKKIKPHTLIGGVPAKVLDENYAITGDYKLEQKYAAILEK